MERTLTKGPLHSRFSSAVFVAAPLSQIAICSSSRKKLKIRFILKRNIRVVRSSVGLILNQAFVSLVVHATALYHWNEQLEWVLSICLVLIKTK